jgi:hypothetical protein
MSEAGADGARFLLRTARVAVEAPAAVVVW